VQLNSGEGILPNIGKSVNRDAEFNCENCIVGASGGCGGLGFFGGGGGGGEGILIDDEYNGDGILRDTGKSVPFISTLASLSQFLIFLLLLC